MKAGIPEEENDYIKTEVEGIPFYIHKEMEGQDFEINWVGFLIFGEFSVKEKK